METPDIRQDEIPIIHAPAVVRNWKKWMGVSCSHAQLIDPAASLGVIQFRDEFKPDLLMHLGDWSDATAWRSGAKGSADESEDVGDDIGAALTFLGVLRPNIVFAGNHDIRPWEKLDHPNAIVRMAAESFVSRIYDFMESINARFIDHYDITRSWLRIGDAIFGHGFMFNENAIRDHAEFHNEKCVIGHLHRLGVERARNFSKAVGYCVGFLGEPEKFSYASRRKATAKWSRGWAYGEYCDDETIINLYDYESKCTKPKYLSV